MEDDSPAERIVFVHEDGTPTGEVGPKLESHGLNTRLHLGFSCYVLNTADDLLVTRRAPAKKVWPGVWTNSVCGHPAPGETFVDAIIRRLNDELGMTADQFEIVLPEYRYTTPAFNGIIENEFCPVYLARATSRPRPNPAEVTEYAWMSKDFLGRAVTSDDMGAWSWWCKDQYLQLRDSELWRTPKHGLSASYQPTRTPYCSRNVATSPL